MVKNPNWQEADQLAIYKCGRGVEPGISGFQVRHPNNSTTLPPLLKSRITQESKTTPMTLTTGCDAEWPVIPIFC